MNGKYTFAAYRPEARDANSSDFVFRHNLNEDELVEVWAECILTEIHPHKWSDEENYEYHITQGDVKLYENNLGSPNNQYPAKLICAEEIVGILERATALAYKRKAVVLEEIAAKKKKEEEELRESKRKQYEALKKEFEPYQ